MDKVLEDLKDLNEEGIEDKKTSKLKKPLYIFSSIILILLVVSFVFVTFPIGDIIRGKTESNLLKGNVIELDEFTIIFKNDSENILQSYYYNEQEVEFSACLEGYKFEDEYHITSLYQPEMYQQSYNRVSFESCSQDTMIILHSHPYKRCVASEQDIIMLERNKVNNPDVLMVVMCEPDRFSVYE